MLAGPVLFYANLCTPFKCEQSTTTAAAHLLGADALVWPDAAALASDLRHVGLSFATKDAVETSPAWHVVTAHFAVPRGLVHSVCVLGTPGAVFAECVAAAVGNMDDENDSDGAVGETDAAEETDAKRRQISLDGLFVGWLFGFSRG